MTALRRTTIASIVVTFVLVTAGGLVRATESGLGCPDWPRCHGRLIPPDDFHARIEFSHRFIASIVIALTIVIAVLAWRHARHRPEIFRPAVATVPLVFAQALLGALVVALELHAESVVAHLLLAMTLGAILLFLLVNLVTPPPSESDPPDRGLAKASGAVALTALAVMLLGSYMSGREAGLAFTDWPLFDGGVVPIGRGELGWLHGLHRMLAGVAGVAVLALAAVARRRAPQTVRRLIYGAVALFGVQFLLGAGNIWTELSEATRTAHLATGAAIWGLLAAATFL
ncbi:MAG TPA: COX15/CtaA family protein, partial [Acidimicrobiia bacterium]|nr:COX15/CtaA family protein [Acidimicrobiia bacterium]